MDIKSLVEKAKQESPEFNRKYTYWTEHRKRKPDLDWLMFELEEALGVNTVQEAAYDYLESQGKSQYEYSKS